MALRSSTPLGHRSPCSSNSFNFPEIFGANATDISASPVSNYTTFSLAPGSNVAGTYTINFCNVTGTYTHPGWGDSITVYVSLPAASLWNGRLQALGGGGYSASFGALYSTQAVSLGYVTIDTDAGHVQGAEAAQSPESWALTSSGNVNLYLLENFGSRSLHEMAVIGKAVTASYYGSQPQYSYFTGCSGGGRQALMIAQRYAEDFDGILATAPAINFENFIPAGYWATQVMHDLGVFPSPCEFKAFTEAAIAACDKLDGVIDGIIGLPELCTFDPHTVVGQSFACDNFTQQFTEPGATIVEAAWTGPKNDNGRVGWFGLNKDAALDSYIITQCILNGTCAASSSPLVSSYLQYLLVKDPNWDPSTMTKEDFFNYLRQSQRDYDSPLGAANPDLSAFRRKGGKMISWHGLADDAIPPNGTIAYYEKVLKLDSKAGDFFRVYEAPGVAHCFGGTGPSPDGALDQLISWVENGVAPETLTAQIYLGGSITDSSSFGCAPRAEVGTPASEAPFF
ncbi:hypothetical protein TruAng_004903 [Truncatella angustata]|nr:hypothetical protein TruAng_004903 [Truncatella angustata]